MGEFLHRSRQSSDKNQNLHQSQQTQLKPSENKTEAQPEEKSSTESSFKSVMQRKWDSFGGEDENRNQPRGPVPSTMVEDDEQPIQRRGPVPIEDTEEEEPIQRLGPVPLQFYAAEEEEEPIQRKGPVPPMNMDSDDQLDSDSSSSDRMPFLVQRKMESSFGEDFSDVNIHKNSSQSTELNAHAFAKGNDIHFAPGMYNPESQKGQELLGHELTHVVQQREERVQPTVQKKGENINDDEGLEKEADEMGAKAARGESIKVTGVGKGIQRKEEVKLDYNSIAKTIHNAIDGLGTDEVAVYKALSKLNHNAAHIRNLKAKYKELYHVDLIQDLYDDFSGDEYQKVLNLITEKITSAKKPDVEPNANGVLEEEVVNKPALDNNLTITDLVGIKKPDSRGRVKTFNQPIDVRKIQDQLFALGFMSEINYKKEVIDPSKENSEIPESKLTETILAIKDFQSKVLFSQIPDGILSPAGNDIKYLGTAVPTPSNDEINLINEARKEFKIISKVSGEDEFKDGLTKEVGDTSDGNVDKDVKAVQKRLVEFRMLKSSVLSPVYNSRDRTKIDKPGESPDSLRAFYPQIYNESKTSILKDHLKDTIAAIKKFQTEYQYNITYWAPKIGKTGDFKIGVIKPEDATYKLLKEATSFVISTGVNEKASFRDHNRTGYTVNPQGVSYVGKVSGGIMDPGSFSNYGLNEREAKGLLEASRHEGKFDAINTYDSATLSFGFIQFAGGNVGNFAKLIARFKERFPADFASTLKKYGMDVEYSFSKNSNGVKNITSAQITIWDNKSNKLLRGIEAERYLAANVELLGILISAAKNINMQTAQIEYATDGWAKPALNKKIGSKVKVIKVLKEDKETVEKVYSGKNAKQYALTSKTEYEKLLAEQRITEYDLDLTNVKIRDVLSSEKGVAAIISLYVNNPTNSILFATLAILNIIEEENLDTLEKVKNISDEKILSKVLVIAREKESTVINTFTTRIGNINKSTLTYEK